MTGFAVAYATFLLTHFVPTRPAIRERLVGAMGRRAWFSLYGLISLAVTVWVIRAAGQAPYVELWPQLPWTRWVPNLLMPLAVAVAALGLPARSATLGGPRVPRVDPGAPGFAALTRHPLLWALSHLAPNGDLSHGLLFGGFAAMAIVAMPVFDTRARREMGAEEARAYFAATGSPSAMLRGTFWREGVRPRTGRLAVALALWAAILGLHPWVIGVSPLPL